jgi:Putative zinc-finger
MLECKPCHDRLLDFVYGLLDEAEAAEVRAHVNACAACQAALTAAQAEQKMLARAARAIRVVPEFAAPSETAPAPVQQPATLPLVVGPEPKRSNWARPIVGWTIAAAILLAVGVPVAWHRVQLDDYQRTLANARDEYKQTEDRLAALPATQAQRHQEAINKVHAEAAPHLHVIGPTSLQPGAKGNLHITTRHPEGNLVPANIRVKLADAGTGDIVKVTRLQTDNNGHARAELDAAGAKSNSKLNLVVEADTGLGMASIQETLRVQAPSFVTRIDTNKSIYQVKDVLFCRVLVLDRHTLQPPTQPIHMHVELIHGKTVVRSIDQDTAAGGILAAEFAVDEKFAEGEYTLSARSADAVQSASARIEIVRALPGIRLDPSTYSAGGTVTGDLVLRGGPAPMPAQVAGTINGMPVPVTLQPQPRVPIHSAPSMPAPGGKSKDDKKAGEKKDGETAAADAYGQVYRFAAPVPKDLPKGTNSLQLSVEVPGDDKLKEELRAVAPLTPMDYDVDFFPEGGDLVAGVPNRVYFRVRAKTGEPVTGDGRLILWMKAKDGSLQISADEPYQLGLGQFEFTPDAKEIYTVRVTTPNTTAVIADPFAKLGGPRADGVVLHVAKAVGSQGEPIRMTIRRQGPPRKLLLVAQCRGQFVDERWVEVKRGSIDLTLEPAPDARGVIRVTAFEVHGADLTPVAERLIYRASTQRLDLDFTPNSREFDAGSKSSAKLSARDESGQPAAAWILASVVDERFQAKPRSLSAHFLLMNEIQGGADFDQAQIILHDSPESAAVLERFLGTHGWRRYVPKKTPVIASVAKDARSKQESETPLIFSRENTPFAQVQDHYEAKIAAVVTPIHKEAIDSEHRLKNERERLADAVALASAKLAGFENRVQIGIRLALGAFVGVLIAVSLFLMGLGVYRILRARRSPTPAFGGAFACLVFCLGTWLAGHFVLGPPQLIDPRGEHQQQARLDVELEKLFGDQLPKIRRVGNGAPTGDYAVASADREFRDGLPDAGRHEQLAKGKQQSVNLVRTPLTAQTDRAADANFSRRFQAAAATATTKAKKAGGGVPPIAPVPRGGAAMEREFAHIHTPGLLADTLLWHPTLWLENGAGEVRFEVGSGQATYRVLLLGNSPTGRLGFFETRLDATGACR